MFMFYILTKSAAGVEIPIGGTVTTLSVNIRVLRFNEKCRCS